MHLAGDVDVVGNVDRHEAETRPADQIGFGYRQSKIGPNIVLSADLQLKPDDPSRVMAWDPWLDNLRDTASFQAVKAQADARYAVAVSAFLDAGGEDVLGPGLV